MHLKDFDYDLPKTLIAQQPLPQRDRSRLMIVNRQKGTIAHTFFHCLPDYLEKDDLLVANDTRVIPARIFGRKKTGGWVELFLLDFIENETDTAQVWECLLKTRRKLASGANIFFSPDLNADLISSLGNGLWRVRLNYRGSFETALEKTGRTPLPPYIRRQRTDDAFDHLDRERYQTVYAANSGAVAAPTAGFHFTDDLIRKSAEKGAAFTFVTLHVGLGTFQPIRAADPEQHEIHKEYYNVTKNSAATINRAYRERKRVIAVGTTAARVLETLTSPDKKIRAENGYTDLYIYPGYGFKALDALITNFHLPRSSLLLLVCAFAGKDLILEAYQQAVEQKYRFFSYGDAMLIL